MPSLFGAKQSFRTKQAAEQFVRHLTRELTAGGIGHWVEVHEDLSAHRWTPIVHMSACPGGEHCECSVR